MSELMGTSDFMKKLSYIKKQVIRRRWIYFMLIPVLAFYIIFHYFPMYGVTMAFKNFNPVLGIMGSPWIGFQHFQSFFGSHFFWRLFRNTFLLSFYNLVFAFPAPIILAILLNEIKKIMFKRTVQTIVYLPYFVSVVVVCGMMTDFLARDGLINDLIAALGGSRTSFLLDNNWFRTVFVASDIWHGIGWGSIIYLAALTNIDPELYDAATIDGAGRFKQLLYVTLPGILSTVIIMFILRCGALLNVGLDKVLLLYSPIVYETADVIQTFVYRRGLIEMNFSYATAVGLFNSIINFTMLVAVNYIARRTQETSLF